MQHLKTDNGERAGLRQETGALVQGSVNAASAAEGLDAGVDTDILSPTLWFLDGTFRCQQFCFIDADGQK